jgi:hypothetical protein
MTMMIYSMCSHRQAALRVTPAASGGAREQQQRSHSPQTKRQVQADTFN